MRALVVQTAHLGDLLLTVPLLRALGEAGDDAGAEVTLLTTPGGAELLSGQRWLHAIHVFGKGGTAGESTWPLVRRLARERYDIAIAAQRSFRTGWFVRSTRAPQRIGFAAAAGRWAYSERVPWDPGRHAVERYLALAGPVRGANVAVSAPVIDVLPEAQERVRALLADRGLARDARPVALAPGSRWGTKRWTPEGFGAVARKLIEHGREVVFVGSADERELCRAIADVAGGVSLAGDTPLPDLAALLSRARALVANDSGTGHLAAAVGTPVVSVFGPTSPSFGYVPYGVPHRVVEHGSLECRPCHSHGPRRCPLGHFRCMREVLPDDVEVAVEALLAENS